MKCQRKTSATSYELKNAVIRLERCDASECATSKVTPSFSRLLPYVDIVDYCMIQEKKPHSQCSHLSVDLKRINKKSKSKNPAIPKSSWMEKKTCDSDIVINVEICKDAISEAEPRPLEVSISEICSKESSAIELGTEGEMEAERVQEMSDISAFCSENADSTEIGGIMFSKSCPALLETAEIAAEDRALMETGEEKDLTGEEKDAIAVNTNEPNLDDAAFDIQCSAIDNEMPLLVSEDVEETTMLEDRQAVHSSTDLLHVFDHMPLLNVEGDSSDLFLNPDLSLPDAGVEQGEVFVAPLHCTSSFLRKNPSAVLTGLNNDVMLGDIGNPSSLLEEEEELLATSSSRSVETATEESADFGESDFAVDELDWNCEESWPLLDPIGGSFQVGQGSLNSSLDARDSDDEFKQKMREEFLAWRLRCSSRREDQENKRDRNDKFGQHRVDSHLKLCTAEDSLVTANGKKFNRKKTDLFPLYAKLKDQRRDKGTAVDVEVPQGQSSDLGHEQKLGPPKIIKETRVKLIKDDRKEIKVKLLKNSSQDSSDKPLGDCKEENSFEKKKQNVASKDIKNCKDESFLSKTLLKSFEAAKLKFTEMKKKKRNDTDANVDEKQKKIEKITEVKNPCRNDRCSSAAQPNSVFCGSECLSHHVQESLQLLELERNKSFNNRNKILGFSSVEKQSERIVVFERKTGKLVTGPLAPTESSLLTWLQRHPTFEVLQPSHSSKNSKQKPSSSGKSKTSSVSDRRRLSASNREDILGMSSNGTMQKRQKKEVDVKMKPQVSKTSSNNFSSADQEKGRMKTDLEILRSRIQSELCNLLLARLDGEMSSVKVKLLASDVEFELWSVFKHSSSLYRQKASSLIRIFKKPSSQELCNRLFHSEVKPRQLVQNLAKYLHSETTAKNTAKDSTVNYSGILPGLTDTTDRHESHVFDVGCRICTGGRPVTSCSLEHDQERILTSPSNIKLPTRTFEVTEQPLPPDKKKNETLSIGVDVQMIGKHESGVEHSQPSIVSSDVRSKSIRLPEDIKSHSVSSPSSSVVSEVVCGDSCVPSALSLDSSVTAEADAVTVCGADASSICHLVNVGSAINSSADLIAQDGPFESSSGSCRPPKEHRISDVVRPLPTSLTVFSDPSGSSSVGLKLSNSRSLEQKTVLSLFESSAVWRGVVSALDGTTAMQVSAYRVSGSMAIVRDLLPSTIVMMGRIAPQVVQQYLQKILEQHTSTREIAIICFSCHDDSERTKYAHLFSYLQEKRRCGVIGSIHNLIKDMYIWPLPANTTIPDFLLPFGCSRFELSKSNLLLGIIVQQARQNNANSFRKPLLMAVPSDKLPSSQHSDSDAAAAAQNLIEKGIRTAEEEVINEESSEEDDDNFKAIADSDPIVSKYSKVKQSDNSVQTSAASSDEDKPYDPFEAEYELNTINHVKSKVMKDQEMTESVIDNVSTSSFVLSNNNIKTSPEITDITNNSSSGHISRSICNQTTAMDGALMKPSDVSTNALHETECVSQLGFASDSQNNVSVAVAKTLQCRPELETQTHEVNGVASDTKSGSKMVPDSGKAISDVMTHSTISQTNVVHGSLDGPPVAHLDSVNSSGPSQSNVEDVTSAISQLFHVEVLSEDNLRTYLDRLMDLRGARTNLEQQKILVELIETVEKASDIANAKTNSSSQSSATIKHSGIDQGSLIQSENISKPVHYEKAETEWLRNSGNAERLDKRSSRSDDSNLLNEVSCSSYEKNIHSVKCQELSLQQHKQMDNAQFGCLNETRLDSWMTENNRLQDTLEQRDSVVASCCQPSYSQASRVPSEIPSSISNINIESILPILSESSVETLKTIVMSAKSVQTVGQTVSSSAQPTVDRSHCLSFSSADEATFVASSFQFSLPVGSSANSSGSGSSSNSHQNQNQSSFLPEEIGCGQLPHPPKYPSLYKNWTRVSAELFPDHQSNTVVRQTFPSDVVSRSSPAFLSSTVGDPRLPYLRNQMPWMSCSNRSDDTSARDNFLSGNNMSSCFLNNFLERMTVPASLGIQSQQQIRRTSFQPELDHQFSQNNGYNGKSQCNSYDANSENANSRMMSSDSVQNLGGESSAKFLYVRENTKPNGGPAAGHGSLISPTYFNFSDNSYEFFGNSSEEILERFLPREIPHDDCLDKDAAADKQQINAMHCMQLGIDAKDMNEHSDEAVGTEIMPEFGGDSHYRRFATEKTVEAAHRSAGRTVGDVNRRLGDREFNRNAGIHSRLDFPGSLRIPPHSFPNSGLQFTSCDANMEITRAKCTETDDLHGSESCEFGEQLQTERHHQRPRRNEDEPQLSCCRGPFQLHIQNHGREISSDPFSDFSRNHGHNQFVPHFTDEDQIRRMERHQSFQRRFDSADGIRESQTDLREDVLPSGLSGDELNGNIRKRRRFDDSCGDIQSHCDQMCDRISYDEEIRDHDNWFKCSPKQEQGYKYDGVFRAASQQNTVCRKQWLGHFSTPQVIDYGHRKRKFIEDEESKSCDIQRRLCDIAIGRDDNSSNSTYRCHGFSVRKHRTRSKERFLNEITEEVGDRSLSGEGNGRSGLSPDGMLAEGFNQGMKTSINRDFYLNCYTGASRDERLSLNRPLESHKDRHCLRNQLCSSKQSDKIFVSRPDDNQSQNRTEDLVDRNSVESRGEGVGCKSSDILPSATKELLAYLKSPSRVVT